MSDQTWTRETIHDEMRTIIAETRGVEEDQCTLEATCFGDLGLESIDFLEISFRMEDVWGFPYYTDDLGEAMNSIGIGSTPEDVREALKILRVKLYLEVPDELPGVEPLDPKVLSDSMSNLFTVGHLVTFVERSLAAEAAASAG